MVMKLPEILAKGFEILENSVIQMGPFCQSPGSRRVTFTVKYTVKSRSAEMHLKGLCKAISLHLHKPCAARLAKANTQFADTKTRQKRLKVRMNNSCFNDYSHE